MSEKPESQSRLQSFVDSPQKALWTLAFPIMAGMGIHTVYTIVDMIFIGRLGGNSIAAVAFNMPLFFLVLGLTMGLGVGVTASIARFIGAHDKSNADNSAEHSIVIGLGISIVLTTMGLMYGEELLALLGAPQEVLPIAWSYLKIICLGLPFMVFSSFFRSILAGEGDMKLPMIIAGFGTILNIIMDPIFIFTLHMGVAGAAMATIISQGAVFFIFTYMLFVKEHTYITFRLRDFSWSWFIIQDIIKVGIPASLSMVIMSFGQAIFNRILIFYSANSVAAYQVAGRMDMLIFLPIMSIGSALTTLVGMFLGAREYEKLRTIVKYGIIRAVQVTIVLSIAVYIFAPMVVQIFTSENGIRSIAVVYLRLITLVYPLVAVGMTSGRVLQGLGKGMPLLVITLIRIVLVSTPLASFFTFLMGKPIVWVWYSMMTSVLISAFVAINWVRLTYRQLKIVTV